MERNFWNLIGNTPLIKIEDNNISNINILAKLEGFNPTGSIKDRAAKYVLDKLINTNEITKNTKIIESSSGNFGVALASYCKEYGFKFYAVIDPNILPINEKIIRSLAYKVIKVKKRDETGGFLLTRLNVIKDILENDKNFYWVNQYGSYYVAEAYKNTIASEICNDVKVDYIFIGVSSGGTITGISHGIKEQYPNAKVIAVDSDGSVIFNKKAKKRCIPGIGSSMRSKIIEEALIDDVVIIDEVTTIDTCENLLKEQGLLVGGSSGTVFAAVKKYFRGKEFNKKPNVVMIFADKGDRYASTIYNDKWKQNQTL